MPLILPIGGTANVTGFNVTFGKPVREFVVLQSNVLV